MTSKRAFLGFGYAVLILGSVSSEALPCHHKLSAGSWNYGSVPAACDVAPFHTQKSVVEEFAPIIFDDSRANSEGRSDYMQQVYPVVREVAKFYIHRRNPRVTPAEEDAFINAVLATVHQESFFTHYRKGQDGRIRSMRGDSLHGFGLMQIDDRSHATNIGRGMGVDFVGNMLLGLDLYYSLWVKTPKARCVRSNTDWRARARSAWAAYNGGPGSICRWTNPKSKWAANDRGYNSKHTAQGWLKVVRDPAAPSPLNIKCLFEGRRPCAVARGMLFAGSMNEDN